MHEHTLRNAPSHSRFSGELLPVPRVLKEILKLLQAINADRFLGSFLLLSLHSHRNDMDLPIMRVVMVTCLGFFGNN